MTNGMISTKPKFNAYCVALLFGDQLLTNCTIAACAEHASALITNVATREHPELGPLTGVAVTKIELPWLQTALSSAETGLAPGEAAPVMSLVPKSDPALPGVPSVTEPTWRTDGTCTAHGIFCCPNCRELSAPPVPLPAE